MTRRILVVGGSGMLSGVVAWLADEGHDVALLCRSPERLGGLAVSRVPVDYRDDAGLDRALADAGPFDDAVVWIHSTAPRAPQIIARFVGGGGHPGRYFHVLGSGAADPESFSSFRSSVERPDELTYHEIVLGFVREGDTSRWLTHEEIAAGVISSIRRPSDRHVVGQVTPWELRP